MSLQYPYNNSPNPLNGSSAGAPLHTQQGQRFLAVRRAGKPDYLIAGTNTEFLPQIGVVQVPVSVRPSLPLVSNNYLGPVSIGPKPTIE